MTAGSSYCPPAPSFDGLLGSWVDAWAATAGGVVDCFRAGTKVAGKLNGHRRSHTVVPHPALAEDDTAGDFRDEAEEPVSGMLPMQMDGDGPLIVREKFHASQPMTIDQALLEMELVGHDFFAYQDSHCGKFSVVYRRRGYDYGVIRLTD